MEENISGTDRLVEFANNTSRKFHFEETPFPGTALHPVTYHRRTFYIPMNGENSIFYACYADSREFTSQFAGVFFEINIPKSEKLMVRKIDILDKIGSIFKKDKCKTLSPEFDKQVIFDEMPTDAAFYLINKEQILKGILSSFEVDPLLRTGINTQNTDFVPELKDKSLFGIYLTNDWIFDSQKIEALFQISKGIKNHLR
jgi:hypothetical protein